MKFGRTAMHTLLGVASLIVAAAWSTYAQGPRPDPEAAYVEALPEGRGKAALVRMCSQCHPIEEIAAAKLSRQGWESRIDEMFRGGASGTAEDVALVRDYLFEIFPARLDINKAMTMDFRVYVGLSEKDGDAIVAYRQRHGPFKTWQDLERVPGIDIKKIRDRSEILFVGQK